jgi:hypothetical protein
VLPPFPSLPAADSFVSVTCRSRSDADERKCPRGIEWEEGQKKPERRSKPCCQYPRNKSTKRPLFRPPDALQHAGQNSAISAPAGSSPANEVPGVRQGNLHRKPVHGNRRPDLHVGRPCFTSSAACEACMGSPHTRAAPSFLHLGRMRLCGGGRDDDGVQQCQCHPHQHGCYLLHF